MSDEPNIVHPVPLRMVKIATARAVKAAGGQEGAADILGVSQQTVSKYQHLNRDVFLSLKQIMTIEAANIGTAGAPHIYRELCRQVGCIVVKLPEADVSTLGDLHAAIARYASALGVATARAIAALADGEVCAAEAPGVIAELDDAIEAAVTLRALLNHIAGEG
jgi:hypothetical protein